MRSFLVVLDQPGDNLSYAQVLVELADNEGKQEGIEQLAKNVYMIPEGRFLWFVSAIAVRLEPFSRRAGQPHGQTCAAYGYKCLLFDEALQWLRFDGSQQ